MTRYLPFFAVLTGTILALPVGAGPPAEEPIPWQVKPDPLPWKLASPFQTGKQIPVAGLSSVLFPTSPSPFCGILVPGDKKAGPQLKMIDLRAMEPVGQSITRDKIQHSFVRVSPWGDHFAILDNKADPPTVWLGTVTGARIVSSIVPHQGKEKIECCDFAGKDQIITCMEVDRKRTWRVWDVKTGKEVLSFDYQLEYSEKWMAFSPGRRYLVMQESQHQSYHLLFWDLQSGKLAGKILMQDPKAPWGQCGNLAFSMDGKELALLWRLHKGDVLAKIMRYDLEKGTKIGELTLGRELEP
jgi:Tol biopolymer transport system component